MSISSPVSARGRAFASLVAVAAILGSADIARAEAPRTPLTVEIRLPDALPARFEPFALEAIVTAESDAPDTVVQIRATEGVALVGPKTFRVDLFAGESRTFAATAVFESTGDHTIRARVRRVVDRDNEIWGDLAAVHFHSTDFGVEFGHGPLRDGGLEYVTPPADGDLPHIVIGPDRGIAVSQDAPPPAPLVVPETADDDTVVPGGTLGLLGGGLTITIRLRGRDPNNTLIDVGQMLGEILNADTDAHIAYFYTNTLGTGTVTFPNPGAAGFYVRWWSYMNWSTIASDDNRMVVRPNGTDDWTEAHKVWTNGYVRADGEHNLGTLTIASDENRRGAFSLLNDMNDAFLYIYFNGGSRSPEGVHVEWRSDSTHGTHYHGGGEVHLEGDDWGTGASLPPSDTMVHEYGHALMYNVYGDTFPPHQCPSPHFIQEVSEPICAWTEGFADFLVVPVNGDPSYDWPSGSSLNLETPNWATGGWQDGDMVEGRVAGALLDIFDSTDDGTDSVSMGFNEIWDTFYEQNDNTFSQFYSAWKSRGYNECDVNAAIYQNSIDYDSAPTLAGLPNVSCNEDAVCNNIIDLWDFTFDFECTDSQLIFEITGNTNPAAGVAIDGNRYIDVNSDPNFVGSSTVTVRVIDTAGKSDTDVFVVTIQNVNDAPPAPAMPTGPSFGVTTVEHDFSASSFDIDGDPVQIRFDFGDGVTSAFSPLVISGQIVTMGHEYASEGVYSVRAQARDLSGAFSLWSAARMIDVSEVTHRYGHVDEDNGGGPIPVLFVNGSAGNAMTREMTADNDSPVVVRLDAAPAGPVDPRFAIWGWVARPTSTTDRLMPLNVGTLCMDPVTASCGPTACPVYAVNTIGKCSKVLCTTPEATGTGAGTDILAIPAGTFAAGTVLTFQGLVKDLSDVDANVQYSITNAVVVTMTE